MIIASLANNAKIIEATERLCYNVNAIGMDRMTITADALERRIRGRLSAARS